jgi:tetratricopeptide (TPR) repeat protein
MHINEMLSKARQSHQLGQHSEALQLYEAVIDQNPLEYSAWCQGASVALEIGSPELCPLAVSWAKEAVRLKPMESFAHYVLGLAYQKAGMGNLAVKAYQQAVALEEDFYQAHVNLGVACNTMGEFEQAQLSLERAIALKPDHAVVHNNLGVTLRSRGQFKRAIECFDRALELKSDDWDAWVNRGFTHSECMNIDLAIRDYEHVLQIEPTHVPARFNLSLMQLLQGDFESGWLGYETRHRLHESETAQFEDVAAYTRQFEDLVSQIQLNSTEGGIKPVIEVVCEQGFGDVLQFCRYVPVLADMGFNVRLKAPAPLHSLLTSLRGLFALVLPEDASSPDTALSLPMMSLPKLLGTQLTNLPSSIPYLGADPQKVIFFQEHINRLLGPRSSDPVRRKLRIGLVWSGGFRAEMPQSWGLNARRNIPLHLLEPLGAIDAHFFTLQKGEPAQSELNTVITAGWRGPQLFDLSHLLVDFSDTAALMMQLDLIVSVDTACAHLAGALGKQVWILNRYDACWRWLKDREDSPWYPNAKLYRQTTPNDWAGVVKRVFTDLDAEVSSFKGTVTTFGSLAYPLANES